MMQCVLEQFDHVWSSSHDRCSNKYDSLYVNVVVVQVCDPPAVATLINLKAIICALEG
jgi:hypothetical protein